MEGKSGGLLAPDDECGGPSPPGIAFARHPVRVTASGPIPWRGVPPRRNAWKDADGPLRRVVRGTCYSAPAGASAGGTLRGGDPPRYFRPAAAVIPAPIAYIKVVAVKKLVVETWAWLSGPPHRVHWFGRAFPSGKPHALHWVCRGTRTFTLKKLECSKQAYARIH